MLSLHRTVVSQVCGLPLWWRYTTVLGDIHGGGSGPVDGSRTRQACLITEILILVRSRGLVRGLFSKSQLKFLCGKVWPQGVGSRLRCWDVRGWRLGKEALPQHSHFFFLGLSFPSIWLFQVWNAFVAFRRFHLLVDQPNVWPGQFLEELYPMSLFLFNDFFEVLFLSLDIFVSVLLQVGDPPPLETGLEGLILRVNSSVHQRLVNGLILSGGAAVRRASSSKLDTSLAR
jgi:hypothetical protein